MKKRVKLLTTIASLCLAVALMAFGVYAATGMSFSVGGSISFVSNTTDGEWDWSATVSGGTFKGTNSASIDDDTYEGLEEGAKATALDVDLGNTNGNVTITITAKFATVSTASRGANLTVTQSGTGCTVKTIKQGDAEETAITEGVAAANGGSFTFVTTITYTSGGQLADQSATWSAEYSAAVGA